jgi:methylenetetrahydrofolate dehydrogenase (NADP+)/methenyltetrahydrofolate cyclohydrolase
MAAKILDGRKIAEEILKELESDVGLLKKEEIQPKLAVVLVEGNPASEIYVGLKKKNLENIGIICDVYRRERTAEEKEILELVQRLNEDESVHGVLVQLPLPPHINTQKVIETVSPEKDVDGFHPVNMGKLAIGAKGFIPATPKGVIRLLDDYGIEIEGKHVVVVGRSNIVGKPLSLLLLQRNATVTVCHSKTRELSKFTRQADILAVAVGYPELILAGMVKEDALVIDIGTNKVGGKLIGDVDFEAVKEKASYITPVPGGVGPMTIAMVAENLVVAAKHRR